jgi:hypothetical protein
MTVLCDEFWTDVYGLPLQALDDSKPALEMHKARDIVTLEYLEDHE